MQRSNFIAPFAVASSSLMLGLVLAILILTWFADAATTDFADAALGQETISVFMSYQDRPIHCAKFATLDDCLLGYEERGKSDLIVWLGNSMLHAINQYEAGQETASHRLFHALRDTPFDLLTFSQPNANLQEHYVLLEFLQTRAPISAVILPVVFDDMREDGIRDDLWAVINDPQVDKELHEHPFGADLLKKKHVPAAATDPDLAGVENTLQEITERYLDNHLAENSLVWRSRPDYRGRIFLFLYRMRNAIFRIGPSTKRRLIPGRFSSNRNALEAMLRSAEDNGISVLVYVPPIRHDAELPYDLGEYQMAKDLVEEIAANYAACFRNFENVVPDQYWGVKESTNVSGDVELDFMHFQAEGHRFLADSVNSALNDCGITGTKN